MNERFSPKFLWDTLYIQQNKPLLATILAERDLNQIDTQSFTNTEVANEHGEKSRIAVVCGHTEAKRENTWLVAKSHLQQCLHRVEKSYPIDSDVETAKHKADYWKPVYGEQSAPKICLRDLAQIAETLCLLFPTDTELVSYKVAIVRLLIQFAEKEGERFSLITQIERLDYTKAQEAYVKFLKEFGLNSKEKDHDQIITLTTKMIGRTIEAKQWKMLPELMMQLVLTSKDVYATATKTNMSEGLKKTLGFAGFIMRDYSKNVSQAVKNYILQRRVSKWKNENTFSANDLAKERADLIKRNFLGLTQTEAINIYS